MRFASISCAAMLCAFSTAAGAATILTSYDDTQHQITIVVTDNQVTPGDGTPNSTGAHIQVDPTAFLPMDTPTSIGVDVAFSLSGETAAPCVQEQTCTDVPPVVLNAELTTFFDTFGIFDDMPDSGTIFDASGSNPGDPLPASFAQNIEFDQTINSKLSPAGLLVPQDFTGTVTYIFTYGYGDSAVPEPASWAMMIVGFGIVGAGLRVARRRMPGGKGAV